MRFKNIGTMEDASRYILGCMRIANMQEKQVRELICTSMECGINFFDHADIYGKGESEVIFGKAMKGIPRDSIYIQSKCGITNGYYDSSSNHILTSVDNILKRLDTDYIDCLLLHRPDIFADPEDTAKSFETLFKSGKVQNFGVSNYNPMQIKLLKKFSSMPLIINQLQLSLAFTGLIDEGLNVNMKNQSSLMHDGSCLNHMRLHDITIQAWSPLQYGFFEGIFVDSDKYPVLNQSLEKIAKKYDITKTAVAIAWINSHPAKMQTILGTTKPQRIKEICKGSDIVLTREEWYELYKSVGNILP